MKKLMVLLVLPLLITCTNAGDPGEGTLEESRSGEPVDWFRDAKFGLFIHWGLYSELAGIWNDQRYYGIGEWIMRRAEIPVNEYAKVAERFNPVRFDAEDWVLQAKNAGMKYIVITSKHHDGFAMFHSKASPFNIVDATPFKRDPLKELAAACRKHGIKLGFYYSQTQDWHEPDASGNNWEFDPAAADFNRYIEQKVKPQLTELLTNYGDLGILWFDTPQNITPEESEALVNWVHNLQPDCLTTSRVGHGFGDYLCLGDHQIPDTIIDRPFEVLFTHNDSWGYTKLDRNYRTVREVLEILLETNSKGGNFLLNVGPKPDGTFPAESSRMLSEVGEWISKNQEAIYASKASPFPPLSWGYCTSRPGVYYFHVMDWPTNGTLRIPDIAGHATSVTYLETGRRIRHRNDGNDLVLDLPGTAIDPLCTVIKVEYDGEPAISGIMTVMEGYPATLGGFASDNSGNTELQDLRWMQKFGDWKYASFLGAWRHPDDVARWTFRVTEPGTYRLVLNYSFTGNKNSYEGVINVADQEIHFEILQTGREIYHFRDHSIGLVSFDDTGEKDLTIKPLETNGGREFIKLRHVRLLPI